MEDKLNVLNYINQKNEHTKFDKEIKIIDFNGMFKWVRIILLKDP